MAAASVRSRDLKTEQFAWQDAKILYTFPKGHQYEGYQVAYLDNPTDTAQLGTLMGHCAGTHFIWTAEERIWYFFAILGPNGQPHVTIHAKETKWLYNPHPRDAALTMPVYGVMATSGYYPSFDDVLKAFAESKLVYEAGKYKPLQYASTTYDNPVRYNNEGHRNWQYCYGDLMQRPDHITDEQWNAYTKLWKEMKDTYDTGIGAVKIVGRSFKFDKKQLTILSFTGKGQGAVSNYRKCFHEFLVELAKASKKKEVVNGS